MAIIKRSVICSFRSTGGCFLLLTSCSDELSHSQRSSSARLHELHLGHDDVVLQHGAAAHADGVASRLVHIDVRAAAVLTHLGAHGDARRASKPDGKKHKDIKTSAANLSPVWNQYFCLKRILEGRTFSCNGVFLQCGISTLPSVKYPSTPSVPPQCGINTFTLLGFLIQDFNLWWSTLFSFFYNMVSEYCALHSVLSELYLQ